MPARCAQTGFLNPKFSLPMSEEVAAPTSGSHVLVDCGPGFHLASPTSLSGMSESAPLKVKSRDRPVGTCGVPVSCSADCVLAHSKGTKRRIGGCCLIQWMLSYTVERRGARGRLSWEVRDTQAEGGSAHTENLKTCQSCCGFCRG